MNPILELAAWPAIGLSIVLTAGVTVQSIRLSSAKTEISQLKLEAETARAGLAEAATNAVNQYRAIEAIDGKNISKALDEERTKTLKAQATAASLTADVERLRKRAAAYASSGSAAASSSIATGASQAASAPGDMLPELLGRMAEAGQQLSAYADRAAIAGETCAAAWPTPLPAQ